MAGNDQRGRLDLKSLATLVEQDEIDTVIVAFPDSYGRLVGKRCAADYFLNQVAKSGTHSCNYLLTVDMEMEPVSGYEFANWESGYGDFHLLPDFRSLRKAAWLDRTAIVICDLYDHHEQPVSVAPRSMLKEQVARADRLGLQVMAGSEAEYYLYDNHYRTAWRQGYRKLRPAGDYIEDYHILQGTREEPFNGELRRNLQQSGIPVECTKGEWGMGQHELNLCYADVVEMADRHLLYKQCAKETAESIGKSVTFMAKPDADAAGSSCHVHVSLWKNGANVFQGDQEFAGVQCSDYFRWFLGGWIEKASELMVLMAPTVNSYKRYQVGSWAPTRLAWARDNRTAGFRIVGKGSSLRIECRIPGADCNPFLTYSGALAAGLYGIEQQIEPPAEFVGNAYDAADVAHVPRTLRDATDQFSESDFAKQAWGEQIVKHYSHFFRTEQLAYDQAVTDWELRRYFERI
ncbi:MAG: glutamine synthetase [Planctomycetaceae bacterium]|nr:glutamine synthetase [Planctomycetaceae bacterium]